MFLDTLGVLYFILFLDNPMFHVKSPLPTCQADVKAPGTAKRTPFLPAENMSLLNVVDPNSFIRKHSVNALRNQNSLQIIFRSPCGLAKQDRQGFELLCCDSFWLGHLH